MTSKTIFALDALTMTPLLRIATPSAAGRAALVVRASGAPQARGKPTEVT